MDMTVFMAVLAILQLVCLWAGKKASKNLQNQEGYFLANKEVKFFPLMMTFVATQIGGGLILGAAEEAYQFGWSVLLYPLGACLGFVVLALGVGKKLAQFQVSTVAELLGEIYRSKLMKKTASILSILSLFMILVAQVIASKKFMVSLGADQPFLFLIFWGIVIFYTVIGGLKAVVRIDIIQASYFIIVFAAGLGFILYTGTFEFQKVIEAGWNSPNFQVDSAKLSGWLLMPLLFMVIEQDMAQRCFAACSPRAVSRAAGYAALCTFAVSLVPIFFGVLGKQLGVAVLPGSSVFMDVTQALTNPWIAAFVGCAVLMAILSTAISLLNAVSSNLSQDFELSSLQGPRSLFLCRSITAGIGVAGVAGSFFAGEIVGLLIQSYELSVYCLFIPVCAALYNRSNRSLSAWLSLIMGAVGFVITRFLSPPLPVEVFCLALSGMGYATGEGIYRWNIRSEGKDAEILAGMRD